MARYRVYLAYPRKRANGRETKTDLITAEDARVTDGYLRLVDRAGVVVAIYRSGSWTACRQVSS